MNNSDDEKLDMNHSDDSEDESKADTTEAMAGQSENLTNDGEYIH